MSGTKRQREKKNKTRPKAGDIGFVPSIQRKYKRHIEQFQKQLRLF